MIQVVSISFQLAGALILLLWSFKAVSIESVKSRCFAKGVSIERNEDGNGLLEKERLQAASREAILNVFAFCNLIVGYGATFWQSNSYSRCFAILYTLILTAVVLGIELVLSWLISRVRFPKDMVLTSQEIENLDVMTNLTASEINDICNRVTRGDLER